MGSKVGARVFALAVALVFALAACGQKGGVHVAGPGLISGVTGVTTGGTTGATTGGTTTGGTTGATTGLTTGGTATTGTTGPVGPGDRTGITATQITIGIHAPATGAAPVQAAAFKAGIQLYWDFLRVVKKEKVLGRTVKVLFANDEYKPTTAVSVCNDMATKKKAFLLIGGAGTDQIRACADFANARGIPYLSPGVQEEGLKDFRSYFAVTMTYKQQMAPLVQLIQRLAEKQDLEKYGDTNKLKIGFVRPNTPNFDDSADELAARVRAVSNFEYKAYTVVKEGNSTEASTVAQQMQDDGVDIVVPITAPTFTTQLALNTGNNGYRPTYMGVAVTNNINQLISLVCNPQRLEFQGAVFFSPWAGWKQVQQSMYDPDFYRTVTHPELRSKYASFNKRNKGGDILLALWGIMKTVHQGFLKAGPNMSRESFIQTMQTFQLKTSVFPDLRYQPGNPFGAQNVHVLLGRCDERADTEHGVERGAQWVTHPDYPDLYSSF